MCAHRPTAVTAVQQSTQNPSDLVTIPPVSGNAGSTANDQTLDLVVDLPIDQRGVTSFAEAKPWTTNPE